MYISHTQEVLQKKEVLEMQHLLIDAEHARARLEDEHTGTITRVTQERGQVQHGLQHIATHGNTHCNTHCNTHYNTLASSLA